MANSKRELETRDYDQRAPSEYVPPSLLPDPMPEPGWAFRYISTAVLGVADAAHVSKRFREGWEPVKAVDHPELQLVGDKNGNVEIGGLMLCKMPLERAQARDAYYAKQAEAQMTSVDNHFMKNNDPRMPLFRDSSSKVQRGFGSGTK